MIKPLLKHHRSNVMEEIPTESFGKYPRLLAHGVKSELNFPIKIFSPAFQFSSSQFSMTKRRIKAMEKVFSSCGRSKNFLIIINLLKRSMTKDFFPHLIHPAPCSVIWRRFFFSRESFSLEGAIFKVCSMLTSEDVHPPTRCYKFIIFLKLKWGRGSAMERSN